METLESISDRLGTTEEIGNIVRTMKSLSAASIRSYENAAQAIAEYERTSPRSAAAPVRCWTTAG